MNIKRTGRPPLPPDRRLVQRSIRMTAEQWARIDRLGLPWLRDLVQRSPEPPSDSRS